LPFENENIRFGSTQSQNFPLSGITGEWAHGTKDETIRLTLTAQVPL